MLSCFHYFRIGPEKGVIHIASGAVNNAIWDMYARSRKKPLWKLVVDFTPVRTFVYITLNVILTNNFSPLGRARQICVV